MGMRFERSYNLVGGVPFRNGHYVLTMGGRVVLALAAWSDKVG